MNDDQVLAAQRTMQALLAANLELIATLDHPVSPETGTAYSQVVQLLGQLDKQLHAHTF